jgi:hypothetical protein
VLEYLIKLNPSYLEEQTGQGKTFRQLVEAMKTNFENISRDLKGKDEHTFDFYQRGIETLNLLLKIIDQHK